MIRAVGEVSELEVRVINEGGRLGEYSHFSFAFLKWFLMLFSFVFLM
jgi:hypothetical protein